MVKILCSSLLFNAALAVIACIPASLAYSPDISLEFLLFYIALLPSNVVFLLAVTDHVA